MFCRAFKQPALRLSVPKRTFLSNPSELAEFGMIAFRDLTTESFSTTIIFSTILARSCLTLPLSLLSRKTAHNQEAVKPLLKSWNNTLLRHQSLINHKLKQKELVELAFPLVRITD